MNYPITISLMKQQFVITHTICQTDPRITRQFGYKHTFCQNFMSTKNGLSLYFLKYLTCFSVGLSRIKVFSVSHKLCIDGLQQIAVP